MSRQKSVAGLRLSITAAAAAETLPSLRKHLQEAHAILKPPLRELSIALVNDRVMADLHMRFMDIQGPTDVLTFPLEMADDPPRPVAHSRKREPLSSFPSQRRSGSPNPAIEDGVTLGPHPLAVAGEVVVCVPEARRKSREFGTTLREELLLYALHGMLHLCGFDDRTEPDFQRMHRTEDEILARLGVGPVFVPRRCTEFAGSD